MKRLHSGITSTGVVQSCHEALSFADIKIRAILLFVGPIG